jgi:hypothetical protein
MRQLARLGAIAIPGLFLALAPATAHEVQVLRGAQPSLAITEASDVVVLRGAEVGGPVPPPETAAPGPPQRAAPAPPARIVQVFIGPVVSQPAPASVLPLWRFPHARRPPRARPAPAVWPHPARPGR